MVLILVTAAVVAGALGDEKNALAIVVIVALFTVLGFIQEYRAEKAIAALKRMAMPNVRVCRDAALREIPAQELVPGDIVQLLPPPNLKSFGARRHWTSQPVLCSAPMNGGESRGTFPQLPARRRHGIWPKRPQAQDQGITEGIRRMRRTNGKIAKKKNGGMRGVTMPPFVQRSYLLGLRRADFYFARLGFFGFR